jgi:hypothetical protein
MEIEKVTPYLLVRYGFDSEYELNRWAENLEGPNWRLSDEDGSALYTDGDSGIAEIGYSEMFDDKGVSISLVECRYVDMDIESLLTIHKALKESE